MGTSGRHISHPLGPDEGRKGYVDLANVMASRSLGMIIKGVHFHAVL